MASTLQRPLRNTRKRKREYVDDDDGNFHHDTKRRKKMTFSDRSADGFCNYCTNPCKLICCMQCYRSWHINCLNKYILNDNTNTISFKSEYSSNPKPKPITKITKINMPKINMPKINMPKINMPKEIMNGINSEIYKWKQKEKENKKNKYPNPNPIKLIKLPLKLSNIIKWFEYNTPLIIKHSKLYNNINKKQITALFICNDCNLNKHKCFICRKYSENIQKCIGRTCGKYYHKNCLMNDKNYKLHTEFYLNGKIKCPLHHCWGCNKANNNNNNNNNIQRKQCWYCPRSYHRNCVPLNSELISVQITDSNDEIQKYPDFRYDIISCKTGIKTGINGCNYEGKDLEFGRNDIKSGIFKWKLWDNKTICEFYKLNNDPFSININMLTDYKLRKNKKKKKKYWPSNFKIIKKNRGIMVSKSSLIDYGKCLCINGCSLNNNCYNYSMDIECTNLNCGSLNLNLCENRQFKNLNHYKNIRIKKTKNKCGYGAFTKRNLYENELIIEYIGQVITKQESNKRIEKLNNLQTKNFYFFQIDSKTVIDGTLHGNESRFLNHSCNANCYTLIWNVNGQNRLGIFAKNNIKKHTQLTYDYQYQVPNVDDVKNLAKCLCGEKNCRFYLGWNKKKANQWRQNISSHS